MSNTDQAPEPTMDEILASIRRIISDEPTDNQKASEGDKDSVADDIARALSFDSGDEPGVIGLDDDILELTEVVAKDDPVSNNGLSGNGINTSADSVPPVPMDFQTTPPAFPEEGDMGEHPVQGFGAEGLSGKELGADDFPDDVFAPANAAEHSGEDAPFGEAPADFGQEPIAGNEVSGVSMSAFDDQAIFADDGLNNPVQNHDAEFSGNESLTSQGSETAVDLSDSDQSAMSTEADDSLRADDTPALGEALSWDSLEEEFGQDAKGAEAAAEESVEQAQGVAEAVEALTGALNEEASLEEDENVTFGQLSPEDNIETALEQAISDIDPEAGWDDNPEDVQKASMEEQVVAETAADHEAELSSEDDGGSDEQVMQAADVQETAEVEVEESIEAVSGTEPADENKDEAENSVSISAEEEEKAETQVQEGMSEDMALSEAAVQQTEKEELAETLSAVKESVVQEATPAEQAESVQSAQQQATSEPQVSEVVPVQKQAPSPLQQQTAAAVSPLEESIKDMLKPMLREWLDDNMPRLLEGAMKEQQKTDQKK
ncbi:MAG: DUF2497 domain-containing protein [Methyloligellaceae bacterium]